ncbi:hypothetical protein E4U42_006108 [Claviceps africana]|uniref:Uncharacterized protein n=1 Tax=Claviceps africana TaxID=83212 RepID=A0A8K0JC03_9HYPO|nr:hypothetical protein E4U42_006108 [Claviceps africana]
MGHTYYYYYEIDGSTETHDPARPSTTACPYLPGQTVNTLYVPIEQTLRSRSASVSSLRQESYMTMDPQARFVTPVPPRSSLGPRVIRRLASASSLLHDRSSDRSESVGPSWKRFFRRKVIPRSSSRPNTVGQDEEDNTTQQFDRSLPDSRSNSLLEGQHTRDISPESLRRFLLDEASSWEPAVNGVSSLNIPSKLDGQVDDDDEENFATPAISEIRLFGASLSPRPLQRSVSTLTVSQRVANSSSLTLTMKPDAEEEIPNELQVSTRSTHQSSEPEQDTSDMTQCDWSSAISFGSFTTPMSSQSLADESTGTYDSDDDDDDMISNTDGDYLSCRSPSEVPESEALQRYSLPRQFVDDKVPDSAGSQIGEVSESPIVTARESDLPVAVTNFLGGPIDTGLDDFVNELGLMAEVIGKRQS